MNELSPTLEEFRKLAVERRVIPVYRRLLADAETAIGLYRKLARNGSWAHGAGQLWASATHEPHPR